jgi:hypothetical protein
VRHQWGIRTRIKIIEPLHSTVHITAMHLSTCRIVTPTFRPMEPKDEGISLKFLTAERMAMRSAMDAMSTSTCAQGFRCLNESQATALVKRGDIADNVT